jgi:hypothetical protein
VEAVRYGLWEGLVSISRQREIDVFQLDAVQVTRPTHPQRLPPLQESLSSAQPIADNWTSSRSATQTCGNVHLLDNVLTHRTCSQCA